MTSLGPYRDLKREKKAFLSRFNTISTPFQHQINILSAYTCFSSLGKSLGMVQGWSGFHLVHPIGHLPSSSVIFHHLPLMEDDPYMKMNRTWSYGYCKRSKDDLRPMSTSSNVHRSSSIIFHWWKMTMEDDISQKMTSTWKLTEIEVMGIQSDPKVI